MIGLIGKKLGMTRTFADDGRSIPVTVIEAGPCVVTQVKTEDSDGYSAVQLGYGQKKPKNTPMPMQGHFRKAGTLALRVVREFRLDEAPDLQLGDTIDVSILAETRTVDVTGVTKGRGFAGMIKRWNKSRGKETHGSNNVREIGSTGSDTRLTHIRPGKHMPGHYGVESVKVLNLEVIRIDKDKNIMLVRGAVAGPNGGYVVVHKTNLVRPAPPKAETKKKSVHGQRK
ncbi:MAG: 50S ribosomal protein L3 [Planctomycetes bacterium]|nr:50S ribosomal protein L3 [Planctomycetota bacterium]